MKTILSVALAALLLYPDMSHAFGKRLRGMDRVPQLEATFVCENVASPSLNYNPTDQRLNFTGVWMVDNGTWINPDGYIRVREDEHLYLQKADKGKRFYLGSLPQAVSDDICLTQRSTVLRLAIRVNEDLRVGTQEKWSLNFKDTATNSFHRAYTVRSTIRLQDLRTGADDRITMVQHNVVGMPPNSR